MDAVRRGRDVLGRLHRQPMGLALFLFAWASTATPHPATAQEAIAVIRGQILDSLTSAPVAAAAVHLVGTDGGVLVTEVSNDSGRFVLEVIAPGTYRVQAERIGYRGRQAGPFTVAAGDTLDVELRLATLPVAVDTLLAVAAREGRPLRPGEQLIYGRLLDDDTGEPIPQGTVTLLGARGPRGSVISDPDGVFHLVSPGPGTYRLQAERIGYRTAESSELYLMLGDSIGVEFRLSTQAVLLEPITVTASARPWWERGDTRLMRQFFQRYDAYSRNGYGEFMTRDSLARWEGKPYTMGQILLANIGTVRAVGLDGTVSLHLIGEGHCPPVYYLNGMQISDTVAAMFGPQDLEGVEVYLAPNIPGVLGMRPIGESALPCGVVAYWSRVSPEESPRPRTFWTYVGVGVGAALFLLLAG